MHNELRVCRYYSLWVNTPLRALVDQAKQRQLDGFENAVVRGSFIGTAWYRHIRDQCNSGLCKAYELNIACKEDGKLWLGVCTQICHLVAYCGLGVGRRVGN
jgi:hypothetical protein